MEESSKETYTQAGNRLEADLGLSRGSIKSCFQVSIQICGFLEAKFTFYFGAFRKVGVLLTILASRVGAFPELFRRGLIQRGKKFVQLFRLTVTYMI